MNSEQTFELLQSGLMPSPRQILPGYDSGVLAMLVGAFLLAAIGLIGAKRLWKAFFRGLAHSGPSESAAASAEITTGERFSIIASLIQTFVCEGLMIFAALHYGHHIPLTPPVYFKCAAFCTLLCALLFLVQRCGYAVTAYTFAPRPTVDVKAWLRAFSATQSMLGVALLLPAIGTLFYPIAAMTLVWVGAALYVAARILFIIKGFRIFYVNGFSVFYFFLYLCTLEIMPVGAIAIAVLKISPHVIY